MADRAHRELLDADIAKIAVTYHAWRGDKCAGEYADVPGFCKAAEDDAEPFEEKMKRLTATWREQQAEAKKLDVAIAANLKELGF